MKRGNRASRSLSSSSSSQPQLRSTSRVASTSLSSLSNLSFRPQNSSSMYSSARFSSTRSSSDALTTTQRLPTPVVKTPSSLFTYSSSLLPSTVTQFFSLGGFRPSLPTFAYGREVKTRAAKKDVSAGPAKREKTSEELDLRKLKRLEREKKKEEVRKTQLEKSSVRKAKETELRQQKVQRTQQELQSQKIITTHTDEKEKLEFERYQAEYAREQERAKEMRKARRKPAQ